MNIVNHFQNILLSNDQKVAIEQVEGFVNNDEHIFILQGYAGTGKTTILKGIIDYIFSLKLKAEVMAPTGKAARILRDKTGFGNTIHKSIYNFKELRTFENNEDAEDTFHYYFPIELINENQLILIVDESSMISSKKSNHELFTFGTNVLLDDLITFSKIPSSKNKIIFVGDPAQLPPVGDNLSNALNPEYFRNLGLNVRSFVLETVHRQKQNTILENAFKIRSLINSPIKSSLEFIYDTDTFIDLPNNEISSRYIQEFSSIEIGNGVVICFSNNQCYQYNIALRDKLFPGLLSVAVGDLLMVTHNNYYSYEVELMNGEMAKVTNISNSVIERKNIPVFDTINGKRVKKLINLSFRELTIKLENHPNSFNCLIIDSLLNAPARDLSILEMKALYVDFVMRFNVEQTSRKEGGLPIFKVGSLEFKERLKTDSFFNALRVKYGYSITCHKAQGGEWDTVFVDYYGRTSLKDEPLRWSYTATTRARNKCYATNAPNISQFSGFSIQDIGILKSIPSKFLQLQNIPVSPFHQMNQHLTKSFKYWELKSKLDLTHYEILNIQSLGEFRERYSIQCGQETIEIQSDHNQAGIFNDFQIVDAKFSEIANELLEIVNRSFPIIFNLDYSPSNELFVKILGLMQASTEDAGVMISNVEENIPQYYVNYYLVTDAKAAYIQFYFNRQQQITNAIVKSTLGMQDHKLIILIEKIKKHVS
jgi:tRNA A37 threonylcarbamoyladenosine biosynthesis protein TsaE